MPSEPPAQTIEQSLDRLRHERATQDDWDIVARALAGSAIRVEQPPVQANTGEGAVQILGDATRVNIITGDNNNVTLATLEGEAAERLLDLSRQILAGAEQIATEQGRQAEQQARLADEQRSTRKAIFQRAIPILAALSIAGFAVVIFLLLYTPPPTLKAMSGQFNIIVAEYGEVTGLDGTQPASTEDGRYLSREIYERLKEEVDAVPDLAGRVEIQHEHIGLIAGTTSTERAVKAAELARSLNADVVIYGYIDRGPLPARFVPQFYVTPRLTGAEELTGENAFGRPIGVQLPLTNADNRARLDAEIFPRLDGLAKFMMGLAYLNAGNYDRSLDFFRLADKVLEWRDNEGKEILYLWIGTAFHELGRADENHTCWFARDIEPGDSLGCARHAFQKASDLNPQFARARIGLGNLWIETAERDLDGETLIDCNSYSRAIEEYEAALQLADSSAPTAFLALKATYNIGLTYASAFRNACDDSDAAGAGERFYRLATEHLNQAIQAYGEAIQRYPGLALVQQLGARAYYQLGLIDNEYSSFDAAIDAFTEAITIATPGDPDQEEAWQSIRWNAYLQRGNARAAQAGTSGDRDAALADYEAVLDVYRASRFTNEAVVSEAFYQAGLLYELKGDGERAREYFTSAAQLPDASPLVVALAQQRLLEMEPDTS